jgi:hypothetical protein
MQSTYPLVSVQSTAIWATDYGFGGALLFLGKALQYACQVLYDDIHILRQKHSLAAVQSNEQKHTCRRLWSCLG